MFKKLLFKIFKIALFRDIFIGLITTFKYLFKKRVTINYPNEKGIMKFNIRISSPPPGTDFPPQKPVMPIVISVNSPIYVICVQSLFF